MIVSTEQATRYFAFGTFVLVPDRQLLLHEDVSVRIGGRALDILSVLAERPGEIITKHELISRVWPNIVVEESNLKVNIAALRRVLGDGPGSSRFIATVTGRGYRFVAPVRTGEMKGPSPSSPVATGSGHNLPITATRIFGRTDTIEAIHRDLDEARLVSIVGAGGIGKTTVALAVAEKAVGKLKDGVWLVDLTLINDSTLLPNAIATVMDLAVHSSDMLGSLCHLLRDRELLLVLDSCEHMIDAAAACVDQILKNAASVRIIATSREPLRVIGERVRRLPGLDAPTDVSGVNAVDALTFPAIQLFVDRATSSFELFKLSDTDVPVITEICRRLDGLALAIELAATRIEAFGAGGILKQLDDRFRLLAGRRAGPERHRTLSATLDWSYGLLPADEAALLRAVSVFPGVFDAEGASAVADVPASDASQSLAQLAEKSLVATDLDGDHVVYRMLETTRTYCMERLHLAGEESQVRRRHAQRVRALLDRAALEWAERPAHEWGAAYRRVLDDLRSALAWIGRDGSDRLMLIELTVAGIQLWNDCSLTEECRRHVSRAIEELGAAELAGTAAEMQLQASLAGTTLFARGILPQVGTSLQRAVEIAVRLGNTDVHLRCLRMMASYELFCGHHDAALQALASFTAVATAAEPAALTNGDAHHGLAEIFDGRIRQSRQRLEARFHEDLQDSDNKRFARFQYDRRVDVGNVLSNAQWLTGSPDTAMRTVEATLERALKTSHDLSLSNALAVAACPVSYLYGHQEKSTAYVAMLDRQVARHGFVAWRPIALFYGAALACEQSRYAADDVARLQQAIAEFHAINHLARMPFYLGVLAYALARRGHLRTAETTIRSALEHADAQCERWCGPELWRIAGAILTLQGKVEEAEGILLKSIALAKEMGALSWQLRAAIDLAQLWRDRSRVHDARSMLQPIYNDFSEGSAARDVAAAAELLTLL